MKDCPIKHDDDTKRINKILEMQTKQAEEARARSKSPAAGDENQGR